MPLGRSEEDEEDATFEQVASMADRLGLKGKQRAAYIDDHMTGLGYEAVQSRETYVRPTPQEPDEGQAGFGRRWGFGGGARPPASGAGQRSNSRDEGDSF